MASKSMTAGQIAELREGSGQAIRQPATAILTVDTRDRVVIDKATGYRIDTTSPNQVYINTQQSLMNGYFTRIGLTEVNMQWTIPNVISKAPWKNNTLLLERGAAAGPGPVTASYTITVPEAFYTPRELANVIETELNGDTVFGSAAWNVVWSEYTNGTYAGGFSISPGVAGVFFRIRPQNQGSSDDLCNLMGFSYPPEEFANFIFGSFASMQYTPYVDISSANLTKKQNVRDNSSNNLTGQNLLARIYISQPDVNVVRDRTDPAVPSEADCSIVGTRPFTLYRQFDLPKQIFWDTQEFINVIDLTLVDYKGRVLYNPNERGISGSGAAVCGNAANYQLTLQVTET